MGLFIAWLCCTHIFEIYPGGESLFEQRQAFTVGMRYGDVLTLALLAIFAPRIGSLGARIKPVGLLCALTALGTAMGPWVLIPAGVPVVVLQAVGFLTAIGGALLFCLWGQIYCQLNSTRVIVYGSISYLLSTIVSFSISVTTSPYTVAFISLLPLASYACAYLAIRGLPAEASYIPGIRYPTPWKLVAIMVLAATISVLSSALLPGNEGGSTMRNLATSVCGVVLLGMLASMGERVDLRMLARIAFPLAVITVLLIPFSHTTLNYVVSFSGKLAYVWFTSFVLILMCSICRRYGVPSLRMFATARACSEGALLAGVLIKEQFSLIQQQHDPQFQVAFVVVGFALVAASLLIWRREPTVNTDWGAAGVIIETGEPAENEAVRFERRLEELATQYGLTEREREVMGFIAQGKTRADIMQELFLSENTVKTHARNLYRKLGVHSKAEVPPLFHHNS